MAAFLDRGELVFEVHACSTRFDHRLHQLEGIQHAAETGFGIGHDGREIIDVILAFGPLDLVGTLEGVVDALDHHRHRIGRIERLVGIHFTGQVGVAGDLPAGEINRLQAGLDLLHGLVARQGAQGIDERLVVDEIPQLLGAALGQGVLDLHRAAQAHHIFGGVAAGDALPARIFRPVFFQSLNLLFASCHRRSPE